MKNEVEKLDLSPITDDWVIGFVEGEGSFTHDREHRRYICPAFLIVNTDIGALRNIQRFFGFGDIKEHQKINKLTTPRMRIQSWQYRVAGFKRCTVLRDFFRGRLRTERKLKQFGEWEKLWGKERKTWKRLSRL